MRRYKPDLVIADEHSAQELRAGLKVPVYAVDGTTITGAERDQLKVGLLAGRGPQGRTVAERVRRRIARTRAATGPLMPAKVYLDQGAFVPPGKLASQLIAAAGGLAVTAASPGELKRTAPTVYLSEQGRGADPKEVRTDPETKTLPAATAGTGADDSAVVGDYRRAAHGPGGAAPGCGAAPDPRLRPVTNGERRYEALLLDAFGTLITVDAPAERLKQAVAAALDIEISLDDAHRAFTAEVTYYADRCHLGRDAESLAALHQECAAIVLEELRIDLDPRRAVELLGHAIQYRAYADTGPLLRGAAERDMPIAIVSNADYSCPTCSRAPACR